jgi:glutathione synthase/RimK-type ligase-like ATP-grasp enzyme
MSILVLAEKRRDIKDLLFELRELHEKPKYLRLSKLMLVSKKNETLIKCLGKELSQYDAVFINARSSLAPFIEPLLEELEKIGSYTNAQKGLYYVASNEPSSFVVLAQKGIPSAKTITTALKQNLEKASRRISYPVLVKTFFGKKEHQSLIIYSSAEFRQFVSSIKTELDAFLVRQYIEGDIISCAVIGEKVFAVKRRQDAFGDFPSIKKGKMYLPAEAEKEIALSAARALGYETARIDLVKEKVIRTDPVIPFKEFNEACSARLEKELAIHLIEKAAEFSPKIKRKYRPIEFIQKIIHEVLKKAGEVIKKFARN